MADIQVKAKAKSSVFKEEGGVRKPKRAGVNMDMTAMVDMAFLLLIFFMVTTVFRRPLAMEINMPEPGAKVQVAESTVLTVFVLRTDEIVTRMGKGGSVTVTWADIERTLRDARTANEKLIVLVKVDPEARYERMVDMMDTLDDANVTRFSLVGMTAADLALFGGLQ
jgi:biopolymer transport protein ExbD